MLVVMGCEERVKGAVGGWGRRGVGCCSCLLECKNDPSYSNTSNHLLLFK